MSGYPRGVPPRFKQSEKLGLINQAIAIPGAASANPVGLAHGQLSDMLVEVEIAIGVDQFETVVLRSEIENRSGFVGTQVICTASRASSAALSGEP